MVVNVERADVLRNPNTDEFFVKFRKVEIKLKAKSWDDAEKEAKEVLDKKYPEINIVID